MTELNSAQIIRETRQTKHYLAISSAELAFVAACPDLNDSEKLIWLTLADQCARDPHYSCTLSQSQIAQMVDKTTNTVGLAINNLRQKGFLKTQASASWGPLTYFLDLPEAGLKALQAAPIRKPLTPPSKTMDPSHKNEVPPPLKTMDTLIYNNINNKKHNHNLNAPNAEQAPSPHEPMQNADALICEFKKIIKEKYQHLPMPKRPKAAMSHFTDAEQQLINERQIALAAIHDGQKIKASQEQAAQFNQKLAEAKPVPPTRPQPENCKLLEFEFDNEYFLIEEKVKNQILQEIPRLYQQKQIQGDAAQKPIQTLLKEIFYYVAKAGSKALDACQLKRFFVARKLCLKGTWERPNGLERQASIQREQKWQQAKIAENKFAKEFTHSLVKSVA